MKSVHLYGGGTRWLETKKNNSLSALSKSYHSCNEDEYKVLVLLSSYNGEDYIRDQLNSISNQEDVKVECLIRDDGSEDNTLKIIKMYCKEHENFHYINGENIGVVRSFNTLLEIGREIECDYYAFCDQDDIWLSNKLYAGIERLKHLSDSIPACYCSNLLVVDKDLAYQHAMRNDVVKIDIQKAFIQNIATGCTQIFNRRALELFLLSDESKMEMHDYYMYLICLYFGKVIYDNEAHIMYRQHGGNVIGVKKRSPLRYIKTILLRNNSKRYRMFEEFYRVYFDMLSDNQRKALSLFLKSEKNIGSRLYILLSPRYSAYNWKTTIGFKIRLLIGRVF